MSHVSYVHGLSSCAGQLPCTKLQPFKGFAGFAKFAKACELQVSKLIRCQHTPPSQHGALFSAR